MGVVPSGFLITGQCGATYQLPAQHLRPASEGWLNNLALLPGDQARHQACGPQEGCDHIYCAVGRAAAGKACFAFTVQCGVGGGQVGEGAGLTVAMSATTYRK